MQYFVSIEDKTYHHWQLELLVESFKLHNLQDQLVVAIAQNSEAKLINYHYNIKHAKNIFLHDNIGQKRGYLPLNKSYSLLLALEQKAIKQPFTIIEPDMILVNPVSHPSENVVFQLKPLFTSEYVEQNHCKIGKNWIPLGNVLTFNNVPNDFFNRVVEWTENLEYERQKISKESWWHTEKVAWVMTLLEHQGQLSYKGVYDYEMTMLDNNKKHNFIHYNNGLPPVFSKYMYRYTPPEAFTMGNLFEVLLSNNPTSTTNYMQEVVRSYLKIRPEEKVESAVVKEFKIK